MLRSIWTDRPMFVMLARPARHLINKQIACAARALLPTGLVELQQGSGEFVDCFDLPCIQDHEPTQPPTALSR